MNPKTILSDMAAGFTTGLFSIPEGMAYAKLMGVNPVYGLYSSMVAPIVASLTTGTILMVSTLTSAIAICTGSMIQQAGIDVASHPSALFTITFLVGAIMFLMGLLRLGSIVNYVSNAVMTGFVAGASLLILVGELGDLTGYAPSGANKLLTVVDHGLHVGQWDPATTAVGFGTIIAMVVLKKIPSTEKAAAVIVLILGTVATLMPDIDGTRQSVRDRRSLAAQQDQLAATQGTVTTNLVEVYRSLGGGWELRQGQTPLDLIPEETQEEMLERTDYWEKTFQNE